MKLVYHLGLNKEIISGAKVAFLPGDPGRVPRVARAFDKEAVELAFKREFRTWFGRLDGIGVVITSTGIGSPSASIVIEELAQLGVGTFIRIGTCGAIQDEIALGDAVITTGSVRLDGASAQYAPIEYPAVASFEITSFLVEAAKSLGIKYHLGITASTATFYPGQERYETFCQYVLRRLQGSMKEWQRLNVLNYEMESAMVFIACAALGLRCGCVTSVVDNRAKQEEIKEEVVKRAEDNAIRIAIEAMRLSISS